MNIILLLLYVYLWHSKGEAIENCSIYINEVELKHDLHVKRLRTDKGGEVTIRDIFKLMVSFMKPPRVMHDNQMVLQKRKIKLFKR